MHFARLPVLFRLSLKFSSPKLLLMFGRDFEFRIEQAEAELKCSAWTMYLLSKPN